MTMIKPNKKKQENILHINHCVTQLCQLIRFTANLILTHKHTEILTSN